MSARLGEELRLENGRVQVQHKLHELRLEAKHEVELKLCLLVGARSKLSSG